jgi:hypothetical protein
MYITDNNLQPDKSDRKIISCKKTRQWKYNVLLRRILTAIVAGEKQ